MGNGLNRQYRRHVGPYRGAPARDHGVIAEQRQPQERLVDRAWQDWEEPRAGGGRARASSTRDAIPSSHLVLTSHGPSQGGTTTPSAAGSADRLDSETLPVTYGDETRRARAMMETVAGLPMSARHAALPAPGGCRPEPEDTTTHALRLRLGAVESPLQRTSGIHAGEMQTILRRGMDV